VLHGLEALIAVHRDDRATRARNLRDLADIHLTAGEMRYHAQFLAVSRALAAERDHAPDPALTALLALFDPESTLRFPQLTENSALWLPDVVRLALELGRRPVAEAAAEASAVEAARQPLPHTRASAEHCRGLLVADPAAVRSAAEAYREIGHPLYCGQALENAAVLLGGLGDTAGARAAYADAIEIYTALEASWDCLRADARMRPLGIRRGVRGARHRPTSGWEALTATELKIADYVAAGYTNPEIATEMFLSRATVNTHISHIFAKLGAHSRVDIARARAAPRAVVRFTVTRDRGAPLRCAPRARGAQAARLRLAARLAVWRCRGSTWRRAASASSALLPTRSLVRIRPT
jgi:DNA-binding CsgD family transcriptional regulator